MKIAKRLLLTFKDIEVEYEDSEDWCDKLDKITSDKDYYVEHWNGNHPEYRDKMIQYNLDRWVSDVMGL